MVIIDFADKLSKIHCAMSQVFGIFADNLQTNKDKILYMKRFLTSIFSVMMVVTSCVAVLSSCKTEEKYDFLFEMPGQITASFGTEIVIPFKAENITSISVAAQPKGWTVVDVDMLNWTITVKSPTAYTADDSSVEENGILRLMGYTAIGTKVYTSSYLSLLNKQVDLTDKYSNCYPLTEMDTRYTIDVTHIGESQTRINPDSVKLLWQSAKSLVQYSSYEKSTGEFTFFVGHEDILDDEKEVVDTRMPGGNAVVAAYGNGGKIIWSWHLWLTGSDIESSAITTSVGDFMDRNLGAYLNSNGSTDAESIYGSYGLYYQWGRKDPMIYSMDYNFSNNEDAYVYNHLDNFLRWRYDDVEDGAGTMEYAVANPMSFVLGAKSNDYDWIYSSHDNSLWSSEQKGVNDPCPRGWRLPAGDLFTAFDIDELEDLASLSEVQMMYGWHLVDRATGAKIFMPGAGRRSFENGVLTNINNYDGYNPMPWIGYYWTAGIDGSKATSMFFDLNTTRAVNNRYEPQKQMYRANAMQVRCVRE